MDLVLFGKISEETTISKNFPVFDVAHINNFTFNGYHKIWSKLKPKRKCYGKTNNFPVASIGILVYCIRDDR